MWWCWLMVALQWSLCLMKISSFLKEHYKPWHAQCTKICVSLICIFHIYATHSFWYIVDTAILDWHKWNKEISEYVVVVLSLSLMLIGIDQCFITEKSTKDKENAMKDGIFIAWSKNLLRILGKSVLFWKIC